MWVAILRNILPCFQARGIDIPMLDNVVNYNFPAKPKLFVHRVGGSPLFSLPPSLLLPPLFSLPSSSNPLPPFSLPLPPRPFYSSSSPCPPSLSSSPRTCCQGREEWQCILPCVPRRGPISAGPAPLPGEAIEVGWSQ